MMERLGKIQGGMQQLDHPYLAGVKKKEATSYQRNGASREGVILDSPSTGPHKQQGTCHHDEKRDPVPASKSGPCDLPR